jgi:CRP-like cAMP-binding protein
MFECLEKSPLFAGLEKDEIIRIMEHVFHQIRTYKSGDVVVLSGDEVNRLMIILQGSVRGEMFDFSGKTVKIEDITSPHLLAPAFLFGRNNRFPVNITANDAVKLLIIPRSSLLALLQENTRILSNYLNIISNRAQFLSDKIRFFSFQSLKGKIAQFLLEGSKHSGSERLILYKTQTELSELFGVTRPSLARAIRELDREGLIEARGKTIRIKDKEGLAGLLK